MQIDPRRLRILLAVARYGGVLAAADELRVSASAISQQMSRLEHEVGYPLLVRHARGTDLTPAGLLLAEAAEEIESIVDRAQAELRRTAGDVAGTVRIGGFQSFISAVVAPNLPVWRSLHPNLAIEVIEAAPSLLRKQLRQGHLDTIVLEFDTGEAAPEPGAGIEEIPLLDEPLKLVAPSGTVTVTSVADLSRLALPWLRVDPSGATHAALERVIAGQESPATRHRYYSVTTGLRLVAAGEGVALIPSLALEGQFLEGVEVYDVPGLGTRRIVLQQQAARRFPTDRITAVTALIREAASQAIARS